MPLQIKNSIEKQIFISIPIAGWQETLALVTAGLQETKKSPAKDINWIFCGCSFPKKYLNLQI